MNFLITMAGRGERFARAGYTLPKLLIPARGRTLLEWSLSSLPMHLCTRLIFAALEEHEVEHDLSGRVRRLLSAHDLRWTWLPEVTRGQAETALAAADHILLDRPLVIFNIDTRFTSTGLARSLTDEAFDGVLGAFRSAEPRFSYAATDSTGCVTVVREKEVISPHALTGLYTFRQPRDFLETARRWIAEDRRVKGEFYIAPMYADLIAQGRRFILDHAESVDILGTPDELAAFAPLTIETEGDGRCGDVPPAVNHS